MNYLDIINNPKIRCHQHYQNYDIVEIPCSGFAPNFKLKIPTQHGLSLKEVAAKWATHEQFSLLTDS